MQTFGRENNASQATVNDSVIFAEGAFKNVFKGEYTFGERAGEVCVCKMFKSGSVFEESYFANELKIVNKAQELINGFNHAGIIKQRIWLNKPTVWSFSHGTSREGEKCLVEPFIENFEKFNSNTGWTPKQSSPWIEVMQALSHYSFHSSNRALLYCDVQGGVYKDGFVVSDPVIMSASGEYGPTDLGAKGISTFFANHKCNKFCNAQWMKPHDQKVYFHIQKGSTMMLPTRTTRAPLTARSIGSRLRNEVIFEE